MLTPNPPNRLHHQHSPTARFESQRAAHQDNHEGSNFARRSPAQGVKFARRTTLPGARESVENGIFSSLQPQNVRLRRAIRNLEDASAHALFPLLFDPQTAGGLLAGVPAERTKSCLSALGAAGYPHATVIGLVAIRSDALEPITIELDGSIVDTEWSTSSRDPSEASAHAKEPV
jgi:hypothetical protein